MADLLTGDERWAIQLLGDVAGLLDRIISTDGSQRNNDRRELIGHIHVVQNAVLSQAAARAYPEYYRLLGDGPDMSRDFPARTSPPKWKGRSG